MFVNKMADEVKSVSHKRTKNSRKRTSNSQDEEDSEGNDLINNLETISKCFGIGGLYSSKKRKIETHKNSLPILNEDWFELEKIKTLSAAEKERYADEITPITMEVLAILRNLSKFYHKIHHTDSKTARDNMTDTLLKDIKTGTSIPTHDKYYCDIGLWKKVMKVNQQVWKMVQQLDDQEKQETITSNDDKSSSDDKELEESSHDLDDTKKKKSFRDFYMEMVTSEFADDLEKIRKDSNLDSKQISVLIDCLETGKDIWTDLDKELLQS